MTVPSSGTGRIRVMEVIGNGIVGGMETFVARLCAQMRRDNGFDVLCLCPYESAATDALRGVGCAVHVAPMPEEPAWRGIEYAAALIADEGIDVLHAHLTNAHLLAGIVGKMTGVPVLATVHGRDVTAPDLAMQRLGDTHLHVVSRATFYQALGAGVQRDRIRCIVNGVDAERFSPGLATGALRAHCGIDTDVPLIGFVGRLSPEKGPELFIRSFALIRGACPDAHGVMIGDGSLRPYLLGLVEELGLVGRVHLVGLRNDMADCLREFALLVSTSHSEGTPLAIMEAQASGLPVVATHVGGVPEIVTMGETGVLVAPGHVEAIANVVVTLLAQPDERARLGIAARRRMMAHFALSARNAEVTGLLEALVHDPATLRQSHRAALTSIKPNGVKPTARQNGSLVTPVDRA